MAESNAIQSHDETSVDDLAPETLSSDLACLSCSQIVPQTASYRCKQCPAENSYNVDLHLFCETCILIHIRKGHEVIDCKGYSPKVCQTHKNLCLMYCNDCQTVFCFNCLGPHCQHRFVPVSEKASEVRKEVFEYLNKFEQLSKSMAFREADVQSVKKMIEELNGDLLSADNLTEFLCAQFAKVLREHSSDWAWIANLDVKLWGSNPGIPIDHQINKRAGRRLADLRNILTLSDGFCVSTFLESKSAFDRSIKEQYSELGIHTARSWCNSFDNLMKFSIESSVKYWRIPSLHRLKMCQLKVVDAQQNSRQKSKDSGHQRHNSNQNQRNNPSLGCIYLPTPSRKNAANMQQQPNCSNCLNNKIIPVDISSVCNEIFNLKTAHNAITFSCFNNPDQHQSYGEKTQTWLIEDYKIMCNSASALLKCKNQMAIFKDGYTSVRYGGNVSFLDLGSCKTSPHPDHFNAHYDQRFHFGRPQTNSTALCAPKTLNENMEPLAFLGHVDISKPPTASLLLWDSQKKSLRFDSASQVYPTLRCETKPSSVHCWQYQSEIQMDFSERMLHYFVSYAETNGNVTIVDSLTRLSIEVCRAEHGLKKVDNLRLTKLEHDRKGQIVLFDYNERLGVRCQFNLQSLPALSFSIMEVCKFKVPTPEIIQLMTILGEDEVIVTETNFYCPKDPRANRN